MDMTYNHTTQETILHFTTVVDYCQNCSYYNISPTDGSSGLLSGYANGMDPKMMTFRSFIHFTDIYILPFLLIFGIIGNVISFVAFMFTFLKQMSSFVYLSALCVSDTGFLICALASWSDNIGLYLYHYEGSCQIFSYLSYVTGFLSVWYVAGFSIERYIAVKFPFKRQELCTTKRAKIVTITLAVVAFVVYTFALWTSGISEVYRRPYCYPLKKYYNLVAAINNADTTITLIIPTILIVWSNTQIAYVLAKFYRTRASLGQLRTPRTVSSRNQPAQNSSSQGSSDTSVIYADTSYNRSQMKVTRMLLIVSIVFLICHIPSHALRVIVFVFSLVNPNYRPSHMLLLIQKFLNFVYYLNFSVNFILYAISGKTFRKALVRLCQRVKRSMSTYVRKSGSTIRLIRRQSSRLQHVMDHVEDNGNITERNRQKPSLKLDNFQPQTNCIEHVVETNIHGERHILVEKQFNLQTFRYLKNTNYD